MEVPCSYFGRGQGQGATVLQLAVVRKRAMFVLCFKSMNDAWVRTDDNKNHGDIDLGIAVEHLCLAAADRRLGSCWV